MQLKDFGKKLIINNITLIEVKYYLKNSNEYMLDS